MFWEQKIQYAALSDVGFRRQNNQDSCVVVLATDRESWQERGHLFVVADGMGGHAVGELASKMAVDTVPHTFDKLREQHPLAALKTALETANQRIHERGALNRDFLRMGTTCTALLLCPLGAVIGHVGDSRCYRIRRGQVDQLTRDHSLIWELIQQRKVRPQDADRLYPRNVITRSLGPEPTVEVDLEGPCVVLPGDTYLLCSDGLTTYVNDAELGMIAGELPPNEACRLLVQLANLRGGSDNITVVIARAGEVPSHAAAPEPPQFAPPSPGGWEYFIAFCALGLVGVVGFMLIALTQHRLVGGSILGLSLLGLMLTAWFRRRREGPRSERHHEEATSNSTIIWRPYRTASAKLTPALIHSLAKIEAELHGAAVEEQWPIDLAPREEAFKKAQAALSTKNYLGALREYARSLDLLMTGVLWQRKQTPPQPRGGKSSEGRAGERLTPPPVNKPQQTGSP